MEHEELTKKIINAAYAVHNVLGFGFAEKVYENAFAIELRKRGFNVVQQFPINVFYDGHVVGEFYADMVVNGFIIIELKAVAHLAVEHEVQLVNYLNGTNQPFGLLINFGTSVNTKRKYRDYVPKKTT
jgi:GxxExxY protein